MAPIDLFILAIVGIGVWRGFVAGIIREVAGVLGVLLAFALGVYLMDVAGTTLEVTFGLSERTASLIGFVVVFVGVLLLVMLLAHLLSYVVGVLMLGPVNKVLGGLLGAFKAVLILSVLFVVALPFGYPGQETRTSSVLYGSVQPVAPAAWGFISDAWPDIERLPQRLSERVEEGVLSTRP